ncbi:retinal-specific ATP-binding cassette transporter-like [Hyposmocoma kahamanoa]|uniref:retinal-specific ATP-binding cassette transporter-like n=1 Tax=Hyposmocoma kahamanoa TaxID=1477025 RepID=UPI000E6D9076|nr:retinal-specific ATP-binding cassette transporter-like [Hyposmocoma kahamanoa]
MFSKLGYQCCDVKGVNFAVRNGEVFGMIGQAGSGKSTVVNMLSGFTVMTKGDCYLDGYFLNSEKNKYLRELTFSTRLEETDEFLTGYENVKLLAKLHGHSPKAAEQLALLYLQYMGLQMYTHVRVSSYTPGCARRLGLAGVLATASRLVLLDSPTANVDTYMRPLISRAIQRLKERNCIVIMAEHSMPWRETEQICSRLALIVRGQFVAIESVYRLRTKFASGFIATIKLKIDSAYFVFGDENETETNTLSNTSDVAATGASIVKREFMEIFPTSKLKDEHLSMLYFRIEDENNSLLYSEMFMKLEQLRAKFSDIIEDYTLSQTSIEQVIETLASEQ